MRGLTPLRSVAAWAYSMLIFTAAPVVALLALGLAGPQVTWLGARAWGRPALWLMGIDLDVRGAEHLRRPGSRIMVVNHQSALDMPIIAAIMPRAPLGLAKAELRRLPPFNVMWWALGQMFVDRRNPEAAHRSLEAVVQALKRRERSVVLAPEGTRSRTGKLGRFKLGAFNMAVATGAPIVPVVIRGAGARMPPGQWWAEPGKVTVDVQPPLDTSRWLPEEVPARAAALEADYRRWLGEDPPSSP